MTSRARLAALLLATLAGCDDDPAATGDAAATPDDLGADAGDETPYPGPSRGFVDVFAASGIRVDGSRAWPFARMGPVNAAAVGDCDEDGLPDAFVFAWNGVGTLWHNAGSMCFEARGTPAGLGDVTPSGAAFGDLDGDGHIDLVVTTGVEGFITSQNEREGRGPMDQSVRVFRNDGACRFTEVSEAWGFGSYRTDDAGLTAGVDLGDVNLDGRLDVVSRRVMSGTGLVRLYLSRPDGTWVESMSSVFGPTPGGNWTNFFFDADDDGLSDLFLLFDEYMGPPARYLRRVEGAERLYAEETWDRLIFAPEYNMAGLMGAASGDVDGDGFLDLYILDLGPQHLYLHRSWRVDVAADAGVQLPRLARTETPTVAFGASLDDYDNDTWPDLAVAVGVTDGYYEPPNASLFHNRGDGTGSFDDVTPLLHQEGTFTSLWMTGSDLDRDGRVDYWMGGFAGAPRLWRNEVSAGRSLAVRLRGRTSNAEGVGAKVTVRLGARSLVQEVQRGGSPWGYGEHRVVFGVGRARSVDGVEVRWPSGYVQRVGAQTAGRELVVTEPDLLHVTPATAAVGATVTVTARPARPDASPLGPGHRVELTMHPGDVALTVTDVGDGTYTAPATLPAAGVYAFTARVDGAAWRARPQAMAR